MKQKSLLLTFLLLGIILSISAEIKLPTFFASDMVLQQQTNAKIWGKAEPNKKVTLFTSWNLKRYTTTSDQNGDWRLSFNTTKAGGPYTMIISDGKVLTLNNILLGEVWLCSGQSNMEMPVKGFNSQPNEGSNMDILRSENSQIRLFSVKRNADLTAQTDVAGSWEEAMPISVRDFSATAYYFGKLLQESLKVPVGLIHSSWGGTPIEAWMSQEMLTDFPSAKIPTANEDVKTKPQTPTVLFQAMIRPLAGVAIKGVIWYQGESNRNRYDTYAAMFKSMSDGWRKAWNQEDTMPFYFCQIAPFGYRDGANSALVREAQTKAAKELNTGMAVLMDAGEENCIHPAKKRVAGERLGLLALNKTYGNTSITCESPVFKNIEIKDGNITVNFEGAPMGLFAKNAASQLFTVAGNDQVFHPAKAVINKNTVIVKCDEVAEPVAVRYAFENFVVGDLFSTEGLPVSSFRSDNW